MERFKAGTIVIVDWRGEALPKELNKLRPAVVVEDDGLFAPNYPNVIVVPLTEDADLAIPDLSVVIDPTPGNGCTNRCYALAPSVGSVSMARVRGTASRLTDEQVTRIRVLIAEAIGAG